LGAPADEHLVSVAVESRRVAIIDDDPSICRLVRSIFEADGWTTHLGADGADAVRLASDELPDLIVLDIMMPVLDGLAALSQIRRNVRTRGIPVILLSAREKSRDLALGTRLGANAYITKPFDTTDLLETASRLVSVPAA
jgi:DNA-binding response OmpR family regulator